MSTSNDNDLCPSINFWESFVKEHVDRKKEWAPATLILPVETLQVDGSFQPFRIDLVKAVVPTPPPLAATSQ